MIIFPKKKPFQFRPYGRKFRCGQWRCIDQTKLHIWDEGKKPQLIVRSIHERMNYDASKKYPHSSLRQQVRQLKRRGLGPVDINFWEFDDDSEVRETPVQC